MTASLFIKYENNTIGRDFAIGDIHGNFHIVEALLEEVGFDKTKDRLFSVGDLVDRGCESYRAIEFINYPWFFPVLGNHESMILNIGLKSYEESYPNSKINKDGNDWYFKLSDHRKKEYLESFSKLPIVIQVGKIGLVHASPLASWRATKNAAIKNRNKKIKAIYWSRRLAKQTKAGKKINRISGIEWVVVGHTIFNEPTVSRNVFFLDTGFYEKNGSMTLIDLNTMNIAARLYNTSE